MMIWLRGQDLNLRPSGYEPDELPGCSTPRQANLALPNFASASRPCRDACAGANPNDLSPVRDAPATDRTSHYFVKPQQRQKAALGAALGLARGRFVMCEKIVWSILMDGIAFNRPGSDLLSRVLRRSTIGAGVFHGRVRKGNGCSHPAMTTRSIKGNVCVAMGDHCNALSRSWRRRTPFCLS